MNCAVSNIISSIVYGSRFEYNDPEFTSLVDRTNRVIQLLGTPSVKVQRLSLGSQLKSVTFFLINGSLHCKPKECDFTSIS